MTCSTSIDTELREARGTRASRRAFLGLLLALAAGPRPAAAHTPYRQWKVYRQRHLVIGASREDAGSYPRAKALEAFLAEALPEASPRVARARTRRRLGDLLATDQLRVVLLLADDAEALRTGGAPFSAAVPDLCALARFEDRVLCARPSFPGSHAWILADAFLRHGQGDNPAGLAIPVHEGAQLAWAGGPMPAPPPETDPIDPDVPHAHH